MNMEYFINALYVGGAIILGFIAYSIFKVFKSAKEKEKPKIIIVSAVVVILSIGMYFGIQYAGLPKLLFPQYYQAQEHQQEYFK